MNRDFKKYNNLVQKDVSLSNYTTYKIGGSANYFAKVNSFDTLRNLLNIAEENSISWFILGGGSNLLISDSGFSGLVIKLDCDNLEPIFDHENNTCTSHAGISMAKLINLYKKNSACGLEFFAGIPGTLGGAIKMNAGRKDKWISDVVEQVTILDKDKNIKVLDKNDIVWDYRSSSISNEQIVLSAQLHFDDVVSNEQQKEIDLQISEYNTKRRAAQPLNYPSCGSVFKNPKGNFAAKLIEDAGLKSYSVGGAQISDKHANFIINNGNATAQDVIDIIQHTQKTVFDINGIMLKPEVKFVGFDKPCSVF